MTPELWPPVNRLHDGSSLQVVLRSQTLLFRGQTVAERAVVLRLLRHLKAHSHRDEHAARLKRQAQNN